MDNLTPEQKEQALMEFEAKQEKRYAIGKTIIIFVVIMDIVLSVFSAIINLNIFTLIISIVFSIMLVSGQPVVRYLFAVKSVLNIIVISYVLTSGEIILPTWAVVVLMAQLAYCIASSVLLFVSQCVTEYMYAKKNG